MSTLTEPSIARRIPRSRHAIVPCVFLATAGAFPSYREVPPELLYLIVAIFGALVGSFLNVVILRVPAHRSIAYPGSQCPSCQAPIRWYDNLPVLSWLILRGKCRSCHAPISMRYAIVEMLTSALFVAVFWNFGIRHNATRPVIGVYMAFAATMIVLTFIDLDHRIIPNVISLPGIVIGLLLSFVLPHPFERRWWWPTLPVTWESSLAAILVGGGALLLIAQVYLWIRKDDGMGMGDVKMIAMIGAFLGLPAVGFVFVFSSLLGSLIGVGLIALSGGSMKTAVPFGPFLAIAAVAYLFVGPELVTLYLSHSLVAAGAFAH